jgi:EAL domain-containing protein (putative c-di-GMP-specific phosphodiesterase class I)
MAEKVARNQIMETNLRHAVENNEFRLLYQPIYDMHQQCITSAEVLLRWEHPEKGLLKPGEFLPVLEESGLIKPVTQWVLREVIKQAKLIRESGFDDFRISINISGNVFKKHTILDMFLNSMRDQELNPDAIMIEITEDTLTDDLNNAKPALRALQEMGAKIALDDFGTGQSSLNHLRDNLIDLVKIDCDFIKDIPSNQADSDLVDAIIAMAHKLHLKVIAEGVETNEQLEFLRWHKCDGIQGYLLSKPITFDEIRDLLTNTRQKNIAL